jgi:DNA-binding NarL/FixJ family response regulator
VAIRVLIADDQAMVRTGFRLILETQHDLHVVAEAADGTEAVALAREHAPDIVLMDVRMPRTDGIDATRQLLRAGPPPGPRVLIVTTFDLDEYVYAALRAGASGFVLKNTPAADLIAGIRAVTAGDGLLSPSVTGRLIQRFARWAPPGNTPAATGTPVPLTSREQQVWRLIARGLSNTQIGRQLVISDTTVKSHVSSLLAKLSLHDRVQAVVLAYETGFVQPGPQAADPSTTGRSG